MHVCRAKFTLSVFMDGKSHALKHYKNDSNSIFITAYIYSFVTFNVIAILLCTNAVFYWHSWLVH